MFLSIRSKGSRPDGSVQNLVSHPLYDKAMQKMLGGLKFSNTSGQIAEIIYEAATRGVCIQGKNKSRFYSI